MAKLKKAVSVEAPVVVSAVAQLLISLQPQLERQRRYANLSTAAYRFIKEKRQCDEELLLLKEEQRVEAEKLQAAIKEMGELHGFIAGAIRERVNHDPAVKAMKRVLENHSAEFASFMENLRQAVQADTRVEETIKQRPLLEAANLAKIHLDQLHQQYRIVQDYKAEVAKKAELCFKKRDQFTIGG